MRTHAYAHTVMCVHVCYHIYIYRNGNSFHIERYAAGEMERIYPSFWDTNQLISVDSWLPTETVIIIIIISYHSSCVYLI
jgi:hypothetical protein